MFTPYSDNIVFYDTEFSSRNPHVGELLSIGAVTFSGEEFYCELEYDGEVSEWATKYVLPTLNGPKLSQEEVRQALETFLGDTNPFLVSYNRDFDIAYTYKLYDGIEAPFHHGSVDFFSVLFGLGYDPNLFSNNNYEGLIDELNLDITAQHNHNALDDAKFLREVYLALLKKV